MSGKSFRTTRDRSVSVTAEGDGASIVEFDGTAETACAGRVKVLTLEPIVIPPGATCPTAGSVQVFRDGANAIVSHTGGGGFEIDLGGDGSTDKSHDDCQQRLKTCE